MMKVIIVDDEPLVQTGIKAMLNWEQYDLTISGIAANGAVAYQMIQETKPDIVIADIRMPVMSGLELARKCYEEKMLLPVFIILSGYEEFSYVKEALKYQVTDYLIKLELTPETLADALKRAMEKVTDIRKTIHIKDTAINSITLLKEQFFIKLILNLFESEQQLFTQAANLGIDLSYPAYATGYFEIRSDRLEQMNPDQRLLLYTSSLEMVKELISKYTVCYVLSLDTRHFCIIFFLQHENFAERRDVIENALTQISSMLYNYYNVKILSSLGSPASSPAMISNSYQDARQIFPYVSCEKPILFFEDVSDSQTLKNVFNFSIFKEDIRKAYAEYDARALYDTIGSISELFETHPTHYVQALDAAGHILYLSLSLLGNGEQILSDIFKDRPHGYRSLYELSNTQQIIDWLLQLRDGICRIFSERNKDYKSHIVVQVKKYIHEHMKEKITLNDVAEAFNISPSYLSTLFSKYNDIGFSDYVNQQKIEAAKELLQVGNLKIYEISDLLGYESSFYFSRVFKKITGLSPRDYMNQSL